MIRISTAQVWVHDQDEALAFYTEKLGWEVRADVTVAELGDFRWLTVAPPGQEETPIELTYNWDPEEYSGGRNFGHLAYEVDDIYAFCKKLMDAGVTINRPPRDGRMAFVRSPDNISIELLQKGEALAPAEPWASMPNRGEW